MWLSAIAIFLASTCPSSHLDNDWDLPDRSVLCEGIDDYHECASRFERELIDRHRDEVYRLDKDSLVFRIAPGEEFVLHNRTKDGDRYEGYHYLGTLGDYHLIRIQLYEGVWYGLLNAATGRLTKVGGLPHLSPSGRWMAAARPTSLPSVSTLIDIWKADDDGFVRTFEERFRTGPVWSDPKVDRRALLGDHFGSPLIRWIDDDLIWICWEYDQDNKSPRAIGYVRSDGTEWRAEHIKRTRDRDFVPTVFGVSGVEPLASACFTRNFSFTGRLYSKSPGQSKRPITNASLSWDSQEAVHIDLSDDGEFSESLPVWTHYFDGMASPIKTRVTVSAAGCKSKTVRIGEHSRPMTLVLKCLKSEPE